MRRSRPQGVALAATLLALGLVGCGVIEDTVDLIGNELHTVEVVNLCGGSNATVDVYIDESLRGLVYLRRSFTVFSGSRDFRAVGTGPYGTTFRNSTNVQRDLEWTLCPARSVRSDADDVVRGDRQILQAAQGEEVVPGTP